MKLDPIIAEAVNKCLYRMPFVLYMLPGAEEPVFFADDGSESDDECPCFYINRFAKPHQQNICIRGRLNAQEAIDKSEQLTGLSFCSLAQVPLWGRDTFIKSCNALIPKLKQRGQEAKTVLSLTEYDSLPTRSCVQRIENLFSQTPDCFRSFFFHPVVGGLWMGASPELLFDYDANSGMLQTMALAGTSTPGCWDEKNRREHRIVADYILSRLASIGVSAEALPTTEKPYGSICHLCTPIHAVSPGLNPWLIADTLSPTPALAGYPLDDALRDIAEFEGYDRGCYGGYLALSDGPRTLAWVNIRCANCFCDRFIFYAGAGILADSNPEAELKEVMNKISNFCKFIQ